ncbi:MAG: hypothetical protein ABGZ35_03345 [Planctomycetaceae bacterium]
MSSSFAPNTPSVAWQDRCPPGPAAPSLRPCLSALLAALCLVSHPARSGEPASLNDRISLVIFAPKGPVLVDLEITVNQKPYRAWVAEFLSQQLDVDRSGGLTVREINRIPQRFAEMLGMESVAAIAARIAREKLFEPAVADAPAEVPREKFDPWFSGQLDRSLQVVAQSVRPAAAVRLGELLDTSGDGSVGPEELAAGVKTLRFRDLDDDQTLSATELLPFRDPRNQLAAVTPEAADLPFVQLDSIDSLSQVTERVIRRYGGESQQVPFSSMRTHPQLLAPFDEDSDRTLSASEFREYLGHRSAHLTWDIQLSATAGQSHIDIKASPFARRFCRVKPIRETNRRGQQFNRVRKVALRVDDMPIEIRSHGGSSTASFVLGGFLGQHFAVADKDRDNLLSEEEFAEMSSSMGEAQLTVDFTRADIDEDDQLSRDELVAWIETDTIAQQSQIEISVKQDGKTLFSLLDRNLDRRLAQRELQEGRAVLEQYDVNDDGQLAESELGTSYVLQIGLGKPAWQRQGAQSMNMEMASTDAILPGIESLSGPQWFRRMDRNQDGDLSRREFLGTRSQFDQLDGDGDSLIGADEADAILANQE